ncbi:hypothetical protein [Streptomyces sp. NPDC057694]|uniref:hypothetical protein n=1 Tax=Streptomyces sp. NPDC057694 TaxID=3346216 RepID=UPI00369A29EE
MTLTGSLIGELEAREAAARARVEALEADLARLTARLENEREAWSRLWIARETVAEVIMDLDGSGATASVAGGPEPENPVHPGVRVVGAITVPHWRQGLSAAVLPDVYRASSRSLLTPRSRWRPSRSCRGSGCPR